MNLERTRILLAAKPDEGIPNLSKERVTAEQAADALGVTLTQWRGALLRSDKGQTSYKMPEPDFLPACRKYPENPCSRYAKEAKFRLCDVLRVYSSGVFGRRVKLGSEERLEALCAYVAKRFSPS